MHLVYIHIPLPMQNMNYNFHVTEDNRFVIFVNNSLKWVKDDSHALQSLFISYKFKTELHENKEIKEIKDILDKCKYPCFFSYAAKYVLFLA